MGLGGLPLAVQPSMAAHLYKDFRRCFKKKGSQSPNLYLFFDPIGSNCGLQQNAHQELATHQPSTV